jgi:hypothetical protein
VDYVSHIGRFNIAFPPVFTCRERIMFKNFRDKVALSGITILGIGVALLVFTFISAYGFLTSATSPPESEGLEQFFGTAFAPLIGTAMRIMYLGVMGWIGSLITIRGVTIIANVPKIETLTAQTPTVPQEKPMSQKTKTAPEKEAKPSEPEFAVIPPEEIAQSQSKPQPEAQKKSGSAEESNS